MNIHSLIRKAESFYDLVIESGFKRDLNDYIQSIQQGHNQHLVFLKDVSDRVQQKFFEFEKMGLKDDLSAVLRDETFIDSSAFEQLVVLDLDATIDAVSYYQSLNTILHQLLSRINENEKEIDKITDVLFKYDEGSGSDDKVLIAVIFKDAKSTGILKEFTRSLGKWNRALFNFHTLIKSDSPSEVQLEGIQNGSIEVICNVDADVSINMAEIFKYAFYLFGAYLSYKSQTVSTILGAFKGNKELNELENKKEEILISAIKDEIIQKLKKLHQARIKTDNNIQKSGNEKKIEDIASIIIDHVINGNELQLLNYEPKEEDAEENIAESLATQIATVRGYLKNMKDGDLKLLLDTLSLKPSEDPENFDKED